MADDYPEPRQERREQKRQAERAKVSQHGKGLMRVYRDAVLKRLRGRLPVGQA